jgi:hypothetical protein
MLPNKTVHMNVLIILLHPESLILIASCKCIFPNSLINRQVRFNSKEAD